MKHGIFEREGCGGLLVVSINDALAVVASLLQGRMKGSRIRTMISHVDVCVSDKCNCKLCIIVLHRNRNPRDRRNKRNKVLERFEFRSLDSRLHDTKCSITALFLTKVSTIPSRSLFSLILSPRWPCSLVALFYAGRCTPCIIFGVTSQFPYP